VSQNPGEIGKPPAAGPGTENGSLGGNGKFSGGFAGVGATFAPSGDAGPGITASAAAPVAAESTNGSASPGGTGSAAAFGSGFA
jgi:hypothetical protein